MKTVLLKRILLAPAQAKQFADRGLDVVATSPEESAAYLKNEVTNHHADQ